MNKPPTEKEIQTFQQCCHSGEGRRRRKLKSPCGKNQVAIDVVYIITKEYF